MQAITVGQLFLEPLTVAHAEAMSEVLADPQIYRYLDYPAPTSIEDLRSQYARLEAGKSPDSRQRWLNWVVRARGQAPIGYVQATIASPGDAWVAYVFSSKHWGRGHAHTATLAMLEHLTTAYGVNRYLATVEADNRRSIRLLERLAFRPATPREAKAHDLSTTERLYVGRPHGRSG